MAELMDKQGILEELRRRSGTSQQGRSSLMDKSQILASLKNRASSQPQGTGTFAPIKQDKTAKDYVSHLVPEKESQGYFQSGAFADGYQFGDVAKTWYGTQKDVRENLYSGVVGAGEKMLDFLLSIAPYLSGASPWSETAVSAPAVHQQAQQQQMESAKDLVSGVVEKDLIDEQKVAQTMDKITGGIGNLALIGQKADDVSVLGEKSDAIAQSLGQMALTQAVGGSVPWWVVTGATSLGGEAESAVRQGASLDQAVASGLISAGAEVLSEKLFGGSGLGEKGLINLDALTSGISNKLVKTLLDYGVDMAAEGAEEVLSSIASNLGTALYREENLAQILGSEEALQEYLDSFVSGAAVGGLMNVGKVGSSLKTKTDYRNGLTAQEQKQFDAEYKDALSKAAKSGKLTKDLKAELYDSVLSDALSRRNTAQQPQSATQGGETAKPEKVPTQAESAAGGQQTAQTVQQTATDNQQIVQTPSRPMTPQPTKSQTRAAVKQAVAKLAQETVDNAPTGDYDRITNQGGAANGSTYAGDGAQSRLPGTGNQGDVYAQNSGERELTPAGTSSPAPNESVGAAPAGFGGDFYRLQAEYGNLPEGENPVRPDDMPASTTGFDRVSQTAVTVKGAEVTPDSLVGDLEADVVKGGMSYIPIKNSDTTQEAVDYINREGWTQALANWTAAVNSGKSGADLVAQGALLLNNAATAGNKKQWLDILHTYQKLGTNTAQGLQAMRILKTLEPSDKLYMIRRSVDQMVADMKLDVDIVLDEDLMAEYENAQTDAQRDAIFEKIQQNVADQIPSTFMDKFTALRYVNMLGNLRTQVRNIAGNIGMKTVSSVKNAVAAGIEEIAYRASGGKFQKTKSFAVSKAQMDAAKADFDGIKNAVMGGGRYADTNAESAEFAQGVQSKRTIFKSDNKAVNTVFKPLEGYRKATNWAMEQGDLIFSKSAYARALAGYLKAQGISETDYSKIDAAVMDDARLYAVKEAQEQTFRDTNWLSGWLAKVGRRKDTPKAVKVISEGIMPFRKTPANVLIRAEEYSPLGIFNSVYYSVQSVRKGTDVTGAQVVNSWAKSITGTGLFALGMLLQSLGVLTTGPDEDEGKEDFESLNGWQNYALVLPDGTNLTIDFLTPAAMPLLMGAELNKLMADDDISLSDLESALTSIGEPLVQMSMLQGVSDALDNVQYAENNLGQFVINSALSYLTQGLTNTALGQLERSFESSRQTTYVDKDYDIPAWMQRTLGKASAKMPFWDYNQIPYINAWGEEEENLPTGLNLVYNLLSPGYVESGRKDALTEELNRLRTSTGESVYPDRAPTYVTVDGEHVNFSAEEYVSFAKDMGQTQKKLLEQVLAVPGYKDLPDMQKAEVVQAVYKYARATAAERAVPEYDASIAKWMKTAESRGNLPEAIVQSIRENAQEAEKKAVKEANLQKYKTQP